MVERSLRRADMRAVLLRSKLAPNTENFLLPIKEAISNARFGCEARFSDAYVRRGKIFVDIRTDPFEAVIRDNGIGLNEDNYDSFLTPFTGNRLSQKGQGFGRFVGLKVFEDIYYYSSFKKADGNIGKIKFKFDVFADEELAETERYHPQENEIGCVVEMRTPRSEYNAISSSIQGEDILASTLRTFLPAFLKNQMPSLTITVDEATFDANEEFKEFFKADHTTTVTTLIDGESHEITLEFSKVRKGRGFKENTLVLLGAGRVVGANQNLNQALGTRHFTDGENNVVYVVAASGPILDQSVNNRRTQLEIDPEDIKSIYRIAVQEILSLENDFVTRRREHQTNEVANILKANPLLRRGLSGNSLKAYIDGSNIGWSREKFLQDLALKQFRNRRDFQKDLVTAFKSPEDFKSKREKILQEIEEQNKNALASYVVYRKDVIELVEHTRSETDDGKVKLEDELHDIVFQRFEDSYSKSFFEHNLWLIDERLSFFSYVASDRTSLGKKRQKGEKVADLAAFDECLILTQGENRDVLVLIEFKRPLRDDYKRGFVKDDPVEQVYVTAESIRERGSFKSTAGSLINISAGTRIYGYVIADLTPTLKKVCVGRDMTQSWDGQGYYDFHKTFDTFVEVISYDKMITDARKRNAAFFKVLLGDLI